MTPKSTPAETVDPVKAARDAAIADLLADPLKYKAKWLKEGRLKNPKMTDEQHEADWQYVSKLYGLE